MGMDEHVKAAIERTRSADRTLTEDKVDEDRAQRAKNDLQEAVEHLDRVKD